MSAFEVVYRLLARLLLPRSWHREHGRELVATALEARGGVVREVASLCATGLRLRARGTRGPATREGWAADGLRLGVLITLGLSFGVIELPRYANWPPLIAVGGSWHPLAFDGAWLAAIVFIGRRRAAAGATLLVCLATMALATNQSLTPLLDGPGGFNSRFPLVLGACAVALLPSARRGRAGHDGSAAWVLAPVPVAVFIAWAGRRAVACQARLGDAATSAELARFNQCGLDYYDVLAATPAVIMGALTAVALVRARRDPRLAIGVAGALVAYAVSLVFWGDQWAATEGGQLLTLGAVGAALLLTGAALARAVTLPPTAAT